LAGLLDGPFVRGEVQLGGVVPGGEQLRAVLPRPRRRRGVGDDHQVPAGAQGGGRGAQDRDPVQLHVRLEERRGDEVRRVRVGPPGGQVRRGEARVLEAAGGGLFAGPGDGGGRDVQAVRPPALL